MFGILRKPFYNKDDETQRKYEMLRAHFVDAQTVSTAVKRFRYSISRFWQLWKLLKTHGIIGLLPEKKGPTRRWKIPPEVRQKIVKNRQLGKNIKQNRKALLAEGIAIGQTTIWRVLKEEGYGRKTRGRINGTEISTKNPVEYHIDSLMGRSITTKFVGIFFLLPYLRLLGVEEWGKICSSDLQNGIPPLKTCLVLLMLKCIGAKRFSHVEDYKDDYGVGIAAGLSHLPGKSTVHTKVSLYKWEDLEEIMRCAANKLKQLEMLTGDIVNIDFHNIPYWGEKEPLAKEYIPTRGKSMRAVKTCIAQDQTSTIPFWTTTRRADIGRDTAVLVIADLCDELFGKKRRKFIFDCRVATYLALNRLNERGTLFVTLRQMSDGLRKSIESIPKNRWMRVYVDIPKRKHKNLRYVDTLAKLNDYGEQVREIIVQGTGHDKTLVVLTNDFQTPVDRLLKEYAWRWREENNISENVDFFSLDKLPGYIELKADVNAVFTMLADQVYKYFAGDIPGHEKCKPETIFRKFIFKAGTVEIRDHELIVTVNKFPAQHLVQSIFQNIDRRLAAYGLGPNISWLGNKKVVYRFI